MYTSSIQNEWKWTKKLCFSQVFTKEIRVGSDSATPTFFSTKIDDFNEINLFYNLLFVNTFA